MHPKYMPSPELTRLLRAQSGVVSRRQALGLGVPDKAIRRFLAEGHWTALAPGVFHAGTTPAWLARAWAGVLLGGPEAVLGGAAAGHLQGMVTEPPPVVSVFTGATHVRSSGASWEFRRVPRHGVGEPPRTRFADTLLDLCADGDDDAITRLIADHVAGSRGRRDQVLAVLRARPRHPHRALIRDVLSDVEEGVRSPLERRYRRDVERAHGLPPARRQARTHAGHRADCRYEPWGLLVELDGRAYHNGSRRFVDMQRDNEHVLQGSPTLRFGWLHVIEACQTASVVGRALQLLGWSGEPSSCARCPQVR